MVASGAYEVDGAICVNSHFGAPLMGPWSSRPDALKDGRSVLKRFETPEAMVEEAITDGALIVGPAEKSS